MISYFLNEATQILETQFKGNVYLSEILEYITERREMTHFLRTLKIITDARHASFMFSADELYTITKEAKKSLTYFDTIIYAIVIDTPKTAALSTIYREIANTDKYRFNIFSTKEAAYKWLNTFQS